MAVWRSKNFIDWCWTTLEMLLLVASDRYCCYCCCCYCNRHRWMLLSLDRQETTADADHKIYYSNNASIVRYVAVAVFLVCSYRRYPSWCSIFFWNSFCNFLLSVVFDWNLFVYLYFGCVLFILMLVFPFYPLSNFIYFLLIDNFVLIFSYFYIEVSFISFCLLEKE